MKLDIKLLKKLCSIISPSRNEQPMISFIINHCYRIPNLEFEMDHYNNIFITKNTTNPEYYPCVIAHMDMVITHKGPYVSSINNGIIVGQHISDKSPCSLGLDDKVGICIALQLLKVVPNLKVVFTTEEELGAIGAREATANIDFFNNVAYLLQADRKGSSDFIIHTNGIDVCSEEFLADMTPIIESFEYTPAVGTLTDVGELCEILGISGCNLSCGYYLQHSTKEYGIIKQMEKCLNLVKTIIETLPCNKTYSLNVASWMYNPQDDPYNLCDEYADYNFQWQPEDWHAYNESCIKAESEFPNEQIPCDTCKDIDCMNCKYANAF